eukprot:gene2637-3041_t
MEEINCPVCANVYVSPHLLIPCACTVCLACYEKAGKGRCPCCDGEVESKIINKTVANLVSKTQERINLKTTELMCRIHPERAYFTYCETCKGPACPDCSISVKHRGHSFVKPTQEHFTERLSQFEASIEKDRTVLKAIEQSIEIGTERLAKLTAQQEEENQRITKAVGELHLAIQAIEHRLKNKELEEMYASIKFDLDQGTKRLTDSVTPIMIVLEQLVASTKDKNHADLMNSNPMHTLDQISHYYDSLRAVNQLFEPFKLLLSTTNNYTTFQHDNFDSAMEHIKNQVKKLTLSNFPSTFNQALFSSAPTTIGPPTSGPILFGSVGLPASLKPTPLSKSSLFGGYTTKYNPM